MYIVGEEHKEDAPEIVDLPLKQEKLPFIFELSSWKWFKKPENLHTDTGHALFFPPIAHETLGQVIVKLNKTEGYASVQEVCGAHLMQLFSDPGTVPRTHLITEGDHIVGVTIPMISRDGAPFKDFTEVNILSVIAECQSPGAAYCTNDEKPGSYGMLGDKVSSLLSQDKTLTPENEWDGIVQAYNASLDKQAYDAEKAAYRVQVQAYNNSDSSDEPPPQPQRSKDLEARKAIVDKIENMRLRAQVKAYFDDAEKGQERQIAAYEKLMEFSFLRYLLAEDDGHKGNYGFTFNPATQTLTIEAIDFDQILYPNIAARYSGLRRKAQVATNPYEKHRFTVRDILGYPRLRDAQPGFHHGRQSAGALHLTPNKGRYQTTDVAALNSFYDKPAFREAALRAQKKMLGSFLSKTPRELYSSMLDMSPGRLKAAGLDLSASEHDKIDFARAYTNAFMERRSQFVQVFNEADPSNLTEQEKEHFNQLKSIVDANNVIFDGNVNQEANALPILAKHAYDLVQDGANSFSRVFLSLNKQGIKPSQFIPVFIDELAWSTDKSITEKKQLSLRVLKRAMGESNDVEDFKALCTWFQAMSRSSTFITEVRHPNKFAVYGTSGSTHHNRYTQTFAAMRDILLDRALTLQRANPGNTECNKVVNELRELESWRMSPVPYKYRLSILERCRLSFRQCFYSSNDEITASRWLDSKDFKWLPNWRILRLPLQGLAAVLSPVRDLSLGILGGISVGILELGHTISSTWLSAFHDEKNGFVKWFVIGLVGGAIILLPFGLGLQLAGGVSRLACNLFFSPLRTANTIEAVFDRVSKKIDGMFDAITALSQEGLNQAILFMNSKVLWKRLVGLFIALPISGILFIASFSLTHLIVKPVMAIARFCRLPYLVSLLASSVVLFFVTKAVLAALALTGVAGIVSAANFLAAEITAIATAILNLEMAHMVFAPLINLDIALFGASAALVSVTLTSIAMVPYVGHLVVSAITWIKNKVTGSVNAKDSFEYQRVPSDLRQEQAAVPGSQAAMMARGGVANPELIAAKRQFIGVSFKLAEGQAVENAFEIFTDSLSQAIGASQGEEGLNALQQAVVVEKIVECMESAVRIDTVDKAALNVVSDACKIFLAQYVNQQTISPALRDEATIKIDALFVRRTAVLQKMEADRLPGSKDAPQGSVSNEVKQSPSVRTPGPGLAPHDDV